MKTLVLAAALATVLLGACGAPVGPEAQIRANIMAMEEALAEHSRADVMTHLAASFSGGPIGEQSLDREGAGKLLAVYLLRYRNIEVLVSQVSVDVDLYEPSLATSRARVALAGGQRYLPESGGLYAVEGQWQAFDGVWKLTRLTWE